MSNLVHRWKGTNWFKRLYACVIVAAGIIASTASAQAEAWTCTYNMEGFKDAFLNRFVISGSDLIETKADQHYQLLQNNEYGLVATSSISKIEKDQDKPTVGAMTVVIDKTTGEFRWVTAIAGRGPAHELNKSVSGKCLKD